MECYILKIQDKESDLFSKKEAKMDNTKIW